MENKIYSNENYEKIKNLKQSIKKTIGILSLIYVGVVVILAFIFMVKYPTVFIASGIVLSIVYAVYLLFLILIKYKRLSSYEKLLNEINRFSLDKVEVKIISKSTSFRTIDDIKFYEYRAALTSDFRKERIILIEENIKCDLEIDHIYNVTLSNTYLVDIVEIEVEPIIIENDITKERISSSVGFSWYLYLLIIGALISCVCVTEYYVNLPSDSEVLRIWIDKPGKLSSDFKEEYHNFASEQGYKDSLIYEYYYEDRTNYSVAFSTVGLFETDIFLLIDEDNDDYENSIEVHRESLFMDLSFVEGNNLEYYVFEGKKIGIKYGDYYIFARNDNTKTQEQLKAAIEFILSNSIN